MTNAILRGKLDAEISPIRFAGGVTSATPRRRSLLRTDTFLRISKKGKCCAVLSLLVSFGIHAMTTEELQNAINGTPDDGRVELTGNVDLTKPLVVNGRRLTIASPEGAHYVITRTSATQLFTKIESTDTDIQLENIEFDGNKAAYGGMYPEVHLVEITGGAVRLLDGALMHDAAVKDGGTIYVHGNGQFVVEDGSEIRDFYNPNYGAAVRIGGSTSLTDGTFLMRGGLITGCHSPSATTVMGGAVYLWGGRFEMSGGAISNNTAAAGGVAGVNLYMGDCRISGDAQIIGNHGGKVDDFIVSSTSKFQLWVLNGYAGKMTLYKNEVPEVGTQSEVWSGDGNTKYATGLGNVSVQGAPECVLDGYYYSGGYTRWGRKMVEVRSCGDMATTEEFRATPLKDNDVVTLATNLSFAETYEVKNATNVTFTSDTNGPWALERGAANFLFMSVSDASVRFENVVLDGRGEACPITSAAPSGQPDYSMLFVKSDAQVTFGFGAVLRNVKSNRRNPGVSIGGTNSIFRMEAGSSIVDCVADGENCYASAVMLGNGKSDEPRPRFEMVGGVISNCTCEIDTSKASVGSGYGGIVYVYGGIFDMKGGSIMENHSKTTCSGAQYYSGVWLISGGARVEGNDGPYRDAYVRDGQSANVRAVGDFRGRVGISSSTALNTSAGVSVEEGATGAWCFFPALRIESPHAVGKIGQDGKTVYWGTVAGRIGNVEFATKEDAEAACPSSLNLDESGRSQLPIAFGGVATEIEKTIALNFDPDEMLNFLQSRGEPLVLFCADEGSAFPGTIQFTLPQGCEKRFSARSRGSVCKLKLKRGLSIFVW